jgi:hypothetical protein
LGACKGDPSPKRNVAVTISFFSPPSQESRTGPYPEVNEIK